MKIKKIICLILFFSMISLTIGVNKLEVREIVNVNSITWKVLFISRFPRVISLIFAGAGVSICGIIMQKIAQNPFVSPTTAATEDSAKLGALIAMILIPSSSLMQKILIAFIFAIIGTILSLKIIEKIKWKDIIIVPLIGIMIGKIIDSITTWLGIKTNLMQSSMTFLQGDFSMTIKGRYESLYITIPLIIIAFFYAKKFTIVGMGEEMSKNLGLNYSSIVKIGVILSSSITAIILITVGSIPFLGIVIPNLSIMYFGDDLSKNLLPMSLLGSLFLIICDVLGRIIIFPYEISISTITGVIGSILFIFILARRYWIEKE